MVHAAATVRERTLPGAEFPLTGECPRTSSAESHSGAPPPPQNDGDTEKVTPGHFPTDTRLIFPRKVHFRGQGGNLILPITMGRQFPSNNPSTADGETWLSVSK